MKHGFFALIALVICINQFTRPFISHKAKNAEVTVYAESEENSEERTAEERDADTFNLYFSPSDVASMLAAANFAFTETPASPVISCRKSPETPPPDGA